MESGKYVLEDPMYMNSDTVTHFLGIWKSCEKAGRSHPLSFRAKVDVPDMEADTAANHRRKGKKGGKDSKGKGKARKGSKSETDSDPSDDTEERSPKRKKKYVEPDGEDEEGDIEIDRNGKGHKKAKLGHPEPKRKGKNPQNQESEDEGPPDGSPCLAGISDEPQLAFLKSLNSDLKYQVLVTVLAMEEVCVLCWFGFCGLCRTVMACLQVDLAQHGHHGRTGVVFFRKNFIQTRSLLNHSFNG